MLSSSVSMAKRARGRKARDELGDLANVTGGRFIPARDPTRPVHYFEEILATLRSFYLISYYLSDPPTGVLPTLRSLEVRVRQDDASVAAPGAIYISASRPGEAAELTDEATSFYEAGDIERALDSFESATAAHWEVPSAHYLRAVVASRTGHLDLAEDSAKWAVFLDPTDTASRALLQDILARKGASLDESLKTRPSIGIWVESASHRSLPLQYVGVHVARIVASHVGATPGVRIIARPRDGGIASGLAVRIRELEDDGEIKCELILFDDQMQELDSKRFELSALEAGLAARDVPPIATQELSETVDRLLERLRLRLRDDRSRLYRSPGSTSR